MKLIVYIPGQTAQNQQNNQFKPVYSSQPNRYNSPDVSSLTNVTPVSGRPSLSFQDNAPYNRRYISPIPTPVNKRFSLSSDGRLSRMSFMSCETFADYGSETTKPSKFRYYSEGLYDDVLSNVNMMSTPQSRMPPSFDLPFIDDGASVCTEDFEVMGYSNRPGADLRRDVTITPQPTYLPDALSGKFLYSLTLYNCSGLFQLLFWNE